MAQRYFKCIRTMVSELNHLTRGKTDVPVFFKGVKYLSSVWSDAVIPFEVTSSPAGKVPVL